MIIGVDLSRAGDVGGIRDHRRRARRRNARASASLDAVERREARERDRGAAQARRVDRDAAAVHAERPRARVVAGEARAELENVLLRRIRRLEIRRGCRRRAPRRARGCPRACPSSCCEAATVRPRARSARGGLVVVRRVRTALQSALSSIPIFCRIDATASTWNGSPKCEAAITAISRASSPKRSGDARFDGGGRDERLRGRPQEDRSVDVARRRTARVPRGSTAHAAT